jgi:hypothetical protein
MTLIFRQYLDTFPFCFYLYKVYIYKILFNTNILDLSLTISIANHALCLNPCVTFAV